MSARGDRLARRAADRAGRLARSTSTSTSRRSAARPATTRCAMRCATTIGRWPARPGRRPDFNPGDCWVTRLAFEPRVAVAAIAGMLQPHVDGGRLTLHPAHQGRCRRRPRTIAIVAVVAVDLDDGRAMRFGPAHGDRRHRARRSAAACRRRVQQVGAETIAETGEPHAQPGEPKPHCVQSFTYTFALRARAAGRAPRHRAPGALRALPRAQPYSLRIEVHGGEIYGEESGWLDYRLYDTHARHQGRAVDLSPPARQRAVRQRASRHDLTLFNWPGNDYRDRSIIDRPAREVAARPAGRQARQPRLPALAADRGAGRRATAAARPSSGCGPTSWAPPTGCRSIPTSASRAASWR